MGEGKVAVAGFGFGLRHGAVDVDVLVASGGAQEGQKLGQVFLGRAMPEGRIDGDDGVCVDEGVAGESLFAFQLQDGVEGEARGFAADTGPELVTQAAKRDGKAEDLGDGLDREGCCGVARGVLRAVGEGDRDAELARVDGGQFGDVVGGVAPVGAGCHLGRDFGQVFGDGHGVQRRKLPIRRRPAAWDFSGWNWVPRMLSRPTMAVIGPP